MLVDAQGGEKLALMERLYCILTDDAVERDLMREKFYFLSDGLLASFKRMQGYDLATYFPGARVEQAYLILAECELATRRAMAEANGVSFTDQPLLPGGLYIVLSENGAQPAKSFIIQNYMPRSKPTL